MSVCVVALGGHSPPQPPQRNASSPHNSEEKHIFFFQQKSNKGLWHTDIMETPLPSHGRKGGAEGIPSQQPSPTAPARQFSCGKPAPLSIVNLLLPLAGQRGYSWKAATPRVQPAATQLQSPVLTGFLSQKIPKTGQNPCKSTPQPPELDKPRSTLPLGRKAVI